MVTGRTASPNQKADQRHTLTTMEPRRRLQGILVLIILLCLTLLGCGGSHTPLYYTAKSSIPPQPLPPGQTQMQPQIPPQPQMQAQPQVKSQPQMQPPIPAQSPPYPQPRVSSSDLQQRLMIQSALISQSRYRDYKVGPEDLLVIDVYGQDALKRELRVNGQGQISMPLVGVIRVGGLTTLQIEQRLMAAYGSQYLRNPQITVEVKEFHHQRVAVTGAVAKPGYYDIIGPRTLLEVLAMAGGIGNKPGPEAGDVVHVIRHQNPTDVANSLKMADVQASPPSNKTLVINIHRLVSGQAPELNVLVENGDVVYVPYAGTAYVAGGVRKPGNVTVNNNLTVSQAVAAAQGVDPLYGTNNIIVMRFDPQGRPMKIEADLKDIMAGKSPDIPVQDNDTIVVVEGEVKKKLWVLRQLLPIPSGGYSIPTR
jgi:polysaccharide export outer membrane protein